MRRSRITEIVLASVFLIVAIILINISGNTDP